jgi:hypothetical protein
MTPEDLGAMLVMMEIMPVLWRWRSKAHEEKAISCHIIYACDVYPFYASYFA